MRIGMFLDMYKPYTSGVTNYTSLNKAYFESLGHEVFVFTFGNRDHEDDEPNVYRSPAFAWGDTGWQLGLRPTQESRLLMSGLDIAHVQHPFLSGRIALAHARTNDIPVVFTSHTRYDLYSDTYAPWVPRELRMAYLRSYLRRFARRIDAVIAPSESIASWLREFGVTRDAVVLPNGVDTARFRSPTSAATRASLGLPEDAVVFCYLGRVGEEKNIPLLVDAFLAAARNTPAALLVIGDGPARAKAEARVAAAGLSERVRFAGPIPYAEVPGYLAVCDVFTTASVTEVHPLVIIEAMAAGLPVAAVRSPGVSDTVEDGVSGLLASEDASELAGRMRLFASDAKLRASLASGARSASAHYDISVTGARLFREYERVISAHRKRTPDDPPGLPRVPSGRPDPSE